MIARPRASTDGGVFRSAPRAGGSPGAWGTIGAVAHPLRLRIRLMFTRPLHWFANKLMRLQTGRANRPVFYDIDETKPELRRLDENWETILAELQQVLPQQSNMPRYHEMDALQEGISNLDDKAWRVYFLAMGWAGKDFPMRASCPKTVELLDGIPNLLQAFFSILEPGKDVPHHEDPMMHYLRYHLALIVPDEDPPKIRVKDQFYTWKTGESMVFDDSWDHEVFNQAKSERVVLVVDFLRPVPWPMHLLNLFLWRLRHPPRRAWESIFKRVRGGTMSPQA